MNLDVIKKGFRFAIAKSLSKAASEEYYIYLANRYYYNIWSVTTDLSKYSIPINPTKIIWIDPMLVSNFTNRSGKFWHDKTDQVGNIKPGEWDVGGDRFDDGWIYRSFTRRFVKKKPWENTEMYQRYCDKYSESQADQLCTHYDQLYKNINLNGYKTQIELVTSGKQSVRSYPYLLTNEITVDIGRDGEFLLVDSKHRLAIAQILEVDQIPIFVLNRHELWAEKIDMLFSEGKTTNHPDLNQLQK